MGLFDKLNSVVTEGKKKDREIKRKYTTDKQRYSALRQAQEDSDKAYQEYVKLYNNEYGPYANNAIGQAAARQNANKYYRQAVGNAWKNYESNTGFDMPKTAKDVISGKEYGLMLGQYDIKNKKDWQQAANTERWAKSQIGQLAVDQTNRDLLNKSFGSYRSKLNNGKDMGSYLTGKDYMEAVSNGYKTDEDLAFWEVTKAKPKKEADESYEQYQKRVAEYAQEVKMYGGAQDPGWALQNGYEWADTPENYREYADKLRTQNENSASGKLRSRIEAYNANAEDVFYANSEEGEKEFFGILDDITDQFIGKGKKYADIADTPAGQTVYNLFQEAGQAVTNGTWADFVKPKYMNGYANEKADGQFYRNEYWANKAENTAASMEAMEDLDSRLAQLQRSEQLSQAISGMGDDIRLGNVSMDPNVRQTIPIDKSNIDAVRAWSPDAEVGGTMSHMSQAWSFGDKTISFTPITEDGRVLSEQDVQEYLDSLSEMYNDDIDGMIAADANGLRIIEAVLTGDQQISNSNTLGELIHEVFDDKPLRSGYGTDAAKYTPTESGTELIDLINDPKARSKWYLDQSNMAATGDFNEGRADQAGISMVDSIPLMTDFEIEKANQWYNLAGEDGLNEYMQALQGQLWMRQARADEMRQQDEINSGGVFSNAAAVIARTGMQVVNAATGWRNMVLAFAGDEMALDHNSPFWQGQRFVQNVDATVAQNIEDTFNGWAANLGLPKETLSGLGQFVYGVVTSSVDSTVSSLIGGALAPGADKVVEAISLAIMGSEAMSTSLFQGLKEGKSPTEACVDALVSGAIETLTEKISWETIFRPKAFGGKTLLKSTVEEGLEEGLGDVGGWLYDGLKSLVLGHETEIQTRIDEAFARDPNANINNVVNSVLMEYASELGTDMLAGAASGGLMSSIVQATNFIRSSTTGARIARNGTVTGNRLTATGDGAGVNLPENKMLPQVMAEAAGMEAAGTPAAPTRPYTSPTGTINEASVQDQSSARTGIDPKYQSYLETLTPEEQARLESRMAGETAPAPQAAPEARELTPEEQARFDQRSQGETAPAANVAPEATTPELTPEQSARQEQRSQGEQVPAPAPEQKTPQATPPERPRRQKATLADNKNVNRLLDLGDAFGADTEAGKAAAEIRNDIKKGKHVSFARVGQLWQAVIAGMDDQQRSTVRGFMTDGVKDRLSELGETPAEIDTVADLIGKAASGEDLTRAERRTLAGSKHGTQVLDEFLSDDTKNEIVRTAKDKANVASYLFDSQKAAVIDMGAKKPRGKSSVRAPRRRDEAAHRAEAAEKAAALTNKNKTARKAESRRATFTETAKDGTETELNGDITRITDIKVDPKTGNGTVTVQVKTRDGQIHEVTADPGEIQLDGSGTAAIIAEVSTDGSRYTAEEANGILQTYKGGDVQNHINEFEAAYRLGWQQYNLPENATDTKKIAHRLGQQYAMDMVKARNEVQRQAKAATKGKGSVRLETEDKNTAVTSYKTLQDIMRRGDEQQASAIDVLGRIADALGVNIVLFESKADKTGRYTGEDGYYDRSTNTIGIDLNAGRGSKDDMSRHALLTIAGHELTHYIENRVGGEAYEALVRLARAEMDKVGQNWDEAVERRMSWNGKNLSKDEARSELVADIMSDMLRDETKLRTLLQNAAQSNPTLFQRITNFLKNLANRLRSAFGSENTLKTEANAILQAGGYTSETVDMWYRLLEEAGKMEGNEMRAEKAGGQNVQNSRRNVAHDEETINKNKAKIANSEPAIVLQGDEFAMGTDTLMQDVLDYYDSLGNSADSKVFGPVILGKREFKDSRGHGMWPLKALLYKAVPDVIRQGDLIEYVDNWKGRNYDSSVLAASVRVESGPLEGDYYVGSIVHLFDDGKNKYYTHYASAIINKNDPAIQTVTTGSTNQSPGGLNRSMLILLESLKDFKTQTEESKNSNIQSSARNTAYMEAVESGETWKAQKLVDEAAVAAGVFTNEIGRPIRLYHGTQNFGFTVFDMERTKYGIGAVYATSNESVANGYSEFGQNRGASSKYIEDDGTDKTIIRNAKNVLNNEYERLSPERAEEIHQKLLEKFRKQADAENDAMNASPDYAPPADADTDFWETVQAFNDLLNEDEYLFDPDEEYRNNYRTTGNNWVADRNKVEAMDRLREYFNTHDDEMQRLKTQGRGYYDLLYKGYDQVDGIIDLEYEYKKLLDPGALFAAKGSDLVTTRDELQRRILNEKNKGNYTLYGIPGENPLVIDAEKSFWTGIKAPMIGEGYYSTDSIVKWAKENGYTSVVIKNVMDPGVVNDYGDDYIFFKSNQLKSADPVTYDDAGNVIPLDERFQKSEKDIRYSARSSFRSDLNKTEAEAFDNLDETSQDIVAALGKGTKIQSRDGEMELAVSRDKHTIAYSARTYHEGGRDLLTKALTDNGHSREEIEDTIKWIDDALDYLEQLGTEMSENRAFKDKQGNYEQYRGAYTGESGYQNLREHLAANVTTYVRDGATPRQVLSTIVNNGDYPVNLDVTLICKKRVAYAHLLQRLIEDGVFDSVKFDGAAIATVNDILKNHGFETQCLGCFVESRRLQIQNWAEAIVEEWNNEVDKRTKHAGSFDFAKGGEKFTEKQRQELVLELEMAGKKNDSGDPTLGTGAVKKKMGVLLDKMPSLRKHLTVADLLTPQGMTMLRTRDQSLFSLVKQRYGAASPKIMQDFVPYSGEVAQMTYQFLSAVTGKSVPGKTNYVALAGEELGPRPEKKNKGETEAEFKERKAAYDREREDLAMRHYLYDIGGARTQSFSDFMIENVFDYIQMFADLAARKYPLHGYTKEIVCLRLFGMTGAKWNGSLIAHNDPTMGKENAGLLPVEEAANGRGIVVEVDGEKYAICFDDYARNQATGSYIQSIGMKDIVALQLDPRYSANVGSITIGVSDKQIRAMLNNDLFRMVIPYHKSGMLPIYARLIGADTYNDYTAYQNTKVLEYRDMNDNVVEGFWHRQNSGKKVKINPDTTFNFNAEVQRCIAENDVYDTDGYFGKDSKGKYIGAARKAAINYVRWCSQAHPVMDGDTQVGTVTFTPKFSSSPNGYDFTKEYNYYKLLEDFNTYDNISGADAVQGAVQMNFPSEENALKGKTLETYKQALRDTGLFTDKEIDKYAAKAQMSFKEIIGNEIHNRALYETAQAPEWEPAVQEVKDVLKKGIEITDEKGNRQHYDFTSTREERSAERARRRKAGQADYEGAEDAEDFIEKQEKKKAKAAAKKGKGKVQASARAEQAFRDAVEEAKAHPVRQFSGRRVIEYRDDNLIAVHNAAPELVEKMMDGGSMAGLSIAVMQAQHAGANRNFGGRYGISFVFGADSIDPAKNPDNHLLGSDAYTPTMNRVRRAYVAEDLPGIFTDLAGRVSKAIDAAEAKGKNTYRAKQSAWMLKAEPNGYDTNRIYDLVRDLEENPAIQELYLYETGKEAPASWLSDRDYLDFAQNIQEQITDQIRQTPERVKTPNGFEKDSTEAVLAAMRAMPLRGSNENLNDAGMQAIREYKSVEELQDDRERITRDEAEDYNQTRYEAAEELDRALNEAATEMAESDEEAFDTDERASELHDLMIEHLSEGIEAVAEALREEGFEDAETVLRNAGVDSQIEYFQSIPSEYAEAKLLRATPFSEIKLAVVPEQAKATGERLTNEFGVPVRYYATEEQALDILQHDTVDAQFSSRQQIPGANLSVWDYLADDTQVTGNTEAEEKALTVFRDRVERYRKADAEEARLEQVLEGLDRKTHQKEWMAYLRAKAESNRLLRSILQMEDNAEMKRIARRHQGTVQQIREAAERGTLESLAERMEKEHYLEVQKLKLNAAEEKKLVAQKVEARYVRKLAQQRAEFVRQQQEFKQLQEIRKEIGRGKNLIEKNIKKVDHLIRHETDYQNVPEDYKPLAETLVRLIAGSDENGGSLVFNGKEAHKLLEAYERIAIVDGTETGMYDADIMATLQELSDAIDERGQLLAATGLKRMDKALYEMNLIQRIAETVQGLSNAINYSRLAFVNGQRVKIQDAADPMLQSLAAHKNYGELQGALGRAAAAADKMMRLNNMTMPYFDRYVNNPGFSSLVQNMFGGESTLGLRLGEAKEFEETTVSDYHYKDWGFDKNKLEFKTKGGRNVSLTREQAMALYAISKREAQTGMNSHHLDQGGFVLPMESTDQAKIFGREKADALEARTNPVQITEEDMDVVKDWLTDEQKAYADEMVRYLSEEMAEYGNETSMALFGIKKYKEKYYYPFQSYSGNLYQRSDAGSTSTTSDARLKHMSFTKALTKNANTPIVLTDFTQTVMNHVQQMITYSSMVVPIETFNRVMNYKFDTGNGQQRTVRTEFERKYGQRALGYVSDYIKDLNGGVKSENRAGLDKFVSLMKKGGVAASLSVALQQPWSIIRAGYVMSHADLLWAGGGTAGWAIKGAKAFKEAKQYAGTANIKDMGRFDTGVGYTATEWLTPKKQIGVGKLKVNASVMGAIDQITGWAPEMMDKLTWGTMWRAVKHEQARLHKDMDPNSEDFLQMCGRRFDEVMRLTQVYDSTVVRSGLMRSSNILDKMVSAFAGEPTITANILMDAFKRHPKKIGNAFAIFILSQLGQAIIKGLMSTIRGKDDDEDERNLREKMSGKVAAQMVDELNPLNLLPIVRDIADVVNGNEIDRSDMSIFNDLYKEGEKIAKTIAAGGIGQEGAAYKNWYQAIENSVGTIAKVLGVPVKNLMRDTRAVLNLINDVGRNAQLNKNNVRLGWLDGSDTAWWTFWWDKSRKAYYTRITDALLSGKKDDAEMYNTYLTSIGVKPDTLKTGVKGEIKDRWMAKKLTDKQAIDLLVKNEYVKSEKDAWTYLGKAADKAAADDAGRSASVYGSVLDAVHKGDWTTAKKEMDILIGHDLDEDTIITRIRTDTKDRYINGEISYDQAAALLKRYRSNEKETDDDRYWKLRDWDDEKANGKDTDWSKYSDLDAALDSGDESAILKAMQELASHGVKQSTLKSALTKWKKMREDAGITINGAKLMAYNKARKSYVNKVY